MRPRVIFSGIQPTGRLHLGNYLGAVRGWVALSRRTRAAAAGAPPHPQSALFSIVDLHAMTAPPPLHAPAPRALADATRDMAASLLACGLAPDGVSVSLFAQGAVREHTELGWLLSCLTPLGWLLRMTQFKDKGGSMKLAPPSSSFHDAISATSPGMGLLAYPILQAADILLYRSTHVPVGADQRQHLELARAIAATANARWVGGDGGGGGGGGGGAEAPLFPLPATLDLSASAAASRIMSLRDGRAKMSKSAPSDATRINLDDSDDDIRAKVAAAKTDSSVGFAPYDAVARPEKANLLTILAALEEGEGGGEATAAETMGTGTGGGVVGDAIRGTGEGGGGHMGSGSSVGGTAAPPPSPRVAALAERYATSPAQAFKRDLTDALIATIAPIRGELIRLRAEPAAVDAVLRSGAERAREGAHATMALVRARAGYA